MRTTNPIAVLFGKSPFRAIQQHAQLVEECAAELLPLFEALMEERFKDVPAFKEKIDSLEGQADDAKNDIRSTLPRSLFMPVDRRDLLDLLHAQDSIADTAQDIAGLVVMRQMRVPEPLREKLLPYVRINYEVAQRCREIINELDELVETGFRGKQGDRVIEMIEELGDLETVTDDQGMELSTLLFEHESEMKPLDVIFWYELVQSIGDIADFAEDVADRLRLLIAQ